MNGFDTQTLKAEIQSEILLLKDMEAGTDEYKATVDGISKLMDRLMDIEKLQLQHKQQTQDRLDRASETSLKCEQLRLERRHHIVRTIVELLGIGIPAGLTIWGTLKTIEFEKEGTVTTILGREFFKNLFHRR